MTFSTYSFVKSISLILLLTSVFSRHSFAQTGEVSINANVVPRRMNVGETASLVIEIKNGEASQIPSRINVPGLDVVKTGSEFFLTIANGVEGHRNVYYYQIKAAAPGRYTIPSIPLEVSGKKYSSEPIEITVIKARTDDLAAAATKPYFGRFVLDKKEIYVNQIVPFDINVFARGKNAISDITGVKLSHESFVIQKFKEIKRNGTELSGNYYSYVVIPSNLFALKPGEHTLGPCFIGINTRDGRSRSIFGVFTIPRVTQRQVETGTVTLKVKPLPPGAPSSFTGGVGDFKLEGKPSATSISVGDPISMNFVVRGIGNFGTLDTPLFSGNAQKDLWKTYEASKSLDPEETSDGLTSGKCTFSQVIIPLKETTEIPPFELTFFDPDKSRYITLKTEAFPITVSAENAARTTTTIDFPAAIDSGENGNTQANANAKSPAEYTDILHIRGGKPKWQSYTAIVPGSKGGPWYFAFHFLCSLGFFTLIGFGIVRWLRSRKLMNSMEGEKITFKQSLKAIPKVGSSKNEFYHAVSSSLALWKEEHREAPEKVLHAIDTLTIKCNAILYAGKTEGNAPLSEAEASEFVSILQKLPKK